KWEWPIIKRRNRKPTITVKCNPIIGVADSFRKKIKNKIENIPLPAGYNLEWGGEYESSLEAQEPLKKSFPLCVLGMFFIIVCLFNSFRKPVIIILVVPLSIIGVAVGLWIFNLSFSFMAILGFLGLTGMLIKNAVILIDQINLDLKAGKSQYNAVLDSAVSRLRPVTMAAGTTVLGMLPLVLDPFYANMAVTIMGGLCAATFLTLVLVPVLYSILYKVKPHVETISA
ncbi:efflux RND transporter permease subunit, partial [bacterium]|nr:efflux RND transporter permease subunit [bacterium]